MTRAACSIVAKNYLAHARVVSRSFLRHNPGARMFMLLIDDVEGYFDPTQEPFELVRLEDLGIPDLAALRARYSVLELATAVKPFLLRRLLERVERLLYLDPDIEVFDALEPLFAALETKAILLTPHILKPVDDGKMPDEKTFLQCGAYNLGFIGVSRRAGPMLAWWEERCRKYCLVEAGQSLFVDQKWIDLVPGMFEGVEIVADPSYNVAYWNLHEGRLGGKVRFVHFSGFDAEHPDVVSKYQTRFTMASLGEGARLFAGYARALLDAGYREVTRWPYSYGDVVRERKLLRIGKLLDSKSCKVCALLPLVDRLGLRSRAQDRLQTTSRKNGLLRRLAVRLLNPCSRHPSLQGLREPS